MFDALIFTTVNALEFNDVRQDVIRVPEVVGRVRQAQTIWDSRADASLDLINFIGAEDATFMSNLRLKNLATAVIQLGLLDRFLKHHSLPKLLVGLSNGDAPLLVAAGRMTFDELVERSTAVNGLRQVPVAGFGNLPLLSGIALAEYSLIERDEKGSKTLVAGEMDVRRLIKRLVSEDAARKIVVVGPGDSHVQHVLSEETRGGRVQVTDSVALDPLLSWFWRARGTEPMAQVQ